MRITVLLFFLSTNVLFAQTDHFIIEFENINLMKRGWNSQAFYFSINGMVVLPTEEEEYLIPYKTGNNLDQIAFSFGDNPKQISYTKFRKDMRYVIEINPCSQYELYPKKNAQIGTIKVDTTHITDDLRIKFCMEDLVLSTIKLNDSFSCLTSAMCRFSSKTVKLIQGEEELDSFNFHFLHGEEILVRVSDQKRIEIELN